MKVLYLITRTERGGARAHVVDLMRGFRDRCEIEVAASEDEDLYLFEEAAKLGIRCHSMPNMRNPMNPVRDTRALLDIIALLRRTRPDLVHTHTSKAGVLGRIAAWNAGIPAMFTAHTWCFAEGTSWTWKALGVPLERLAALPGGLIINVSEANRNLALQYRIARAEKLITIHNGIPDEEGAPLVQDPIENDPVENKEAPVIIMVARFAPQKNQAMLLDAAARIKYPFHLLFVGAGPTLQSMIDKARELGLEDRCTFAGNRGDVPELLRRSSIFALPTRWEGFPLSTLEAMRAGLPVVASDVGGVREAVIHGENGFLLDQTDAQGFQEALERLLADPALRERMARCGRRMFEERFTAGQMLEKTFGLYCMAVPHASEGRELQAMGAGEHA
jgi:glycosyltransferase involved in cell wall biosynthesis